MNAVELDVGNLWLWLQIKRLYTARVAVALVNNTNQNGYILYFSDHRGMQPDPDANRTGFYNNFVGISGLEDVVNSGSATGVPDGGLEVKTYYTYSPEDVDENGILDTFGAKYLGAGFGLAGAAMSQPYYIPGTTSWDPCLQPPLRTTGDRTAPRTAVGGWRHEWRRRQLPATAHFSGDLRKRIHRRFRRTCLRLGKLQQRPGGSFLGQRRCKRYDSALCGRDHCGRRHAALAQLVGQQQLRSPRTRGQTGTQRTAIIASRSRLARAFPSRNQPGARRTSAPTVECTTSSAISKIAAAPTSITPGR